MSKTDPVTQKPNDKQTPGSPSDPEPVAPPDYDGHAEGQVIDVNSEGVGQRRAPSSLPDDGSADLEDVPVGGLQETRESDDGLGPVNEDEDEPGPRDDAPARQSVEEAGLRS